MDGKRKLSGTILICLILSSCAEGISKSEVEVVLNTGIMPVRAELPDEEIISDVNLYIFRPDGSLEYMTYDSSGAERFHIKLLNGERYSVYALVNFGHKIIRNSVEDMLKTEYHLVYPDDYRNGIPMYAHTDVLINDNSAILLEPVRLMSKISIRMDRSRLSEGVDLNVTAVRIGNCPKKVKVFETSRAESEDDCFITGFAHSGPECRPLNVENKHRISNEISLYMLENMQGRFSDIPLESDEEKEFKEYDSRSKTCSFIEIEIDYSSPLWTSMGKPLTYRFYLGEDINSLDIERNCHYHIMVSPEDDGLKGEGWRVDKSGLKYTGETSLVKYPAGYIRGNIGDTLHIGCILTPDNAEFDVGREYLEEDRQAGIYDYRIDKDGHGATLILTGPGQGLIYMEAGDPINEAALFIVEVNLPDLQNISQRVYQDRVL